MKKRSQIDTASAISDSTDVLRNHDCAPRARVCARPAHPGEIVSLPPAPCIIHSEEQQERLVLADWQMDELRTLLSSEDPAADRPVAVHARAS